MNDALNNALAYGKDAQTEKIDPRKRAASQTELVVNGKEQSVWLYPSNRTTNSLLAVKISSFAGNRATISVIGMSYTEAETMTLLALLEIALEWQSENSKNWIKTARNFEINVKN